MFRKSSLSALVMLLSCQAEGRNISVSFVKHNIWDPSNFNTQQTLFLKGIDRLRSWAFNLLILIPKFEKRKLSTKGLCVKCRILFYSLTFCLALFHGNCLQCIFAQFAGKRKCVYYNRDWYVVVTSFASGLVLSAVFAFLLNCFCRRCSQAKREVTTTNESIETLETQTHSDDFNQFYEEVPGGDNDDFKAIGSRTQTSR